MPGQKQTQKLELEPQQVWEQIIRRRQAAATVAQPEQQQQNRRKPYYYALSKGSKVVYIEGYFNWERDVKWRPYGYRSNSTSKSYGGLIEVARLERCCGKNWRSQFDELNDLGGKSPDAIFTYFGLDWPTEFIEPKTLMETWSSALEKDNRDAKTDEGPNSDRIFAQRMVADDGLKPMSDAGWLDKKSIRRTIDKTLHSDLTTEATLDKNLARLAKYRLKKEHAVGNYIFGKWKRDRYQRKEAALATLLKANYVPNDVQLQAGLTFDVLTSRQYTLSALGRVTGHDDPLGSRQVKRLKLKR